MPLLLLVVRERALIAIAYAALVVKFVGLAVAQTHVQVLVAIAFGSLTVMAYPSISSIKANGVPDHEQGAVQGALSGATALASGIGPLVFNQLYSWATTTVFLPRVRHFYPHSSQCCNLVAQDHCAVYFYNQRRRTLQTNPESISR